MLYFAALHVCRQCLMNDPELPVTEPVLPADTSQSQEQLRELTSQSWNLELLISGAAIFATLSLPDLLDTALAYYRYNLMPDTDYMHDILPAQVLGLIKGVSYVLFIAFLANFVMRAFWVGLVGLLAVYPDGIRYDQIYNLSRYAQQRYEREMGTLPDYIIRLDRRCNVIFALAFGLALMLLGIASIYGLFLGFMTLLQLILPADTYALARETIFIILLAIYFIISSIILVLNLPKLRDRPSTAPLAFRLSQLFSLLFLGLYRPLLYIMYTFTSQIPKRIAQRRLIVMLILFVVAEMIFLAQQTLQTIGASSLLDSRSFISLRDPSRIADASAYDNLRPANTLIGKASIQADVIREPYIRLFIGYPKLLDAELAIRYKEPVWPDTLSKKERREKRAAWYLDTFKKYFGVYLNDSLYRSPDFLFTQRADNEQRGLTTVLLNSQLKEGRNTLRITVPDSANIRETYVQIPFWYVPER